MTWLIKLRTLRVGKQFKDVYAPNFEKVGGHIGFGLSVCMYVRMYVFMFEISS